jgi:hypothetical protein
VQFHVLSAPARPARRPAHTYASVSYPSIWHIANQSVPIVPYFHHGGQVPLLPSSLPTSAVSTVDLPEYPQVAVFPPSSSSETLDALPDASLETPTIDISIDSPVEERSKQDSTSGSSVSDTSDSLDDQMKGRKPAIATAGTFFGLFAFSQIYQNVLFDRITPYSERLDEKEWVASSQSWIDRKGCSWFGVCGLSHLNKGRWTSKGKKPASAEQDKIDLDRFREEAQALPDDFDEQEVRQLPQYVLDYAPLIHLYSGENFWPCDMDDHLVHTTPHLNYTPLQSTDDHPTLKYMNELNKWGWSVYLQSDDNVEDRPDWLGGETNIPEVPGDSGDDGDDRGGMEDSPKHNPLEEDEDGQSSPWWHVGIGDTEDRGGVRKDPNHRNLHVPSNTPEGEELVDKDDKEWQSELRKIRGRRNVHSMRGKKIEGGRSDAPAVLVVVPKGDGVVDAFWFFFYSYNLGNTVFNVRFGNHVGDWEHTTVRFHNGVPKAIFFSEHAGGEAYTYEAVEKIGKRVCVVSVTRSMQRD